MMVDENSILTRSAFIPQLRKFTSNLTSVTGLQDLLVELLVEIFSWLVASDEAQALVSHVCGHWRTVALKASLWSTLVLMDSSI
jgi:hypothetical protein